MKKVKKNTNIIFILDRSGSMACVEDETIKSYNDFLSSQRKAKGNVFVTTVLFDDKYELLYSKKNICDVKNITKKEYYARGCTALMDAIGKTIVNVDRLIAKDERVLIVIMTDGLENASIEYNKETVKKMIKKHKNFEFVFLGANIDSYQEGTSIGISRKGIANFSQNEKSVGRVFACASMLCDGEEVNLQEELNK